MRAIGKLTLGFVALCFAATAACAIPPTIDDPDKYAAEVIGLIAKPDIAAASKMVATSVGKPDSVETLENALSLLKGRTIDYSDKVVDSTFGKSLRQIVYYTFIEEVGFVYFRFNFKRSSHGWILANFNFKSEGNELFPKDFIDTPMSPAR